VTTDGSARKCLVIGASGGIGRALVGRLAGREWGLVLAGRREDAVRELAEEYSCEGVGLDAADFRAVDEAFRAHEGIDAVVNLAGSILLKPAHSTSLDEFNETIDVNLRTAFAVVRAAGRAMRSGGGSVVLMSTCAASVGLANHEAISAAKAGVEGLTRAAAATYAAQGIRVNAVAPGLVRTPLSERITGNEASLKASEAMHPLGRIGEPGEVARVIEFLLDSASDWITGQVLGVDGGLARVTTR